MSLSEFQLIRRYFAAPELSFSRSHVELGIGDDAAAVSVPADELLTLAMDVLVESVHFPKGAPARFVAHRALAANLSDLAAMGSRPLCFTLGVTLPAADPAWLEEFAAGLATLARRFDCPLVGGDVTRGPLTVAIQVHGLSPRGRLIRRHGAARGDRILVTGTLGDAALGLALVTEEGGEHGESAIGRDRLTPEQNEALRRAYYEPEPRVEFAVSITGLVTSGIDISDGLLGDLGHIIAASGVGACVNVDGLPLSDAALAAAGPDRLRRAALTGGDDFELCLTATPPNVRALEQRAAQAGIALTCIGEITSGQDIILVDARGEPVPFPGAAYEHFRETLS